MQSEFITAVENFLEKSGLEPTKLGIYAVGNPNLVSKLRKGKGCTLRTADRVLAFIKANKDLNFRLVSPVVVTIPQSNHHNEGKKNVSSSN